MGHEMATSYKMRHLHIEVEALAGSAGDTSLFASLTALPRTGWKPLCVDASKRCWAPLGSRSCHGAPKAQSWGGQLFSCCAEASGFGLDHAVVANRDAASCHWWPWHRFKHCMFLNMFLCYHKFSHQKFSSIHNLWDHFLVPLTSILFLGDVRFFSVWIQGLPFGPHYFNAICMPCNTLSFYLCPYLLL